MKTICSTVGAYRWSQEITCLYLCCSCLYLCCSVCICVFYVLFVCKYVLYYCHWVLTQLQLANISYHIILCIVLLFLLLQWHYSALQTFASVIDFSQSALFFYLSFQFVIQHLLMSVCTQFHHLFFGHPLGRLNLRIVVKYLTSLLLSILLT